MCQVQFLGWESCWVGKSYRWTAGDEEDRKCSYRSKQQTKNTCCHIAVWANVTSCVSLNAESPHLMLQFSLCKSQHTARAFFSQQQFKVPTIHCSQFLVYPFCWYYMVICRYCVGNAVVQLVEALCYKSEGCRFVPWWCHWNFSLT